MKKIIIGLLMTIAAFGESCILKQDILENKDGKYTIVHRETKIVTNICIDGYEYIQNNRGLTQKLSMQGYGYGKHRIAPTVCSCLAENNQ